MIILDQFLSTLSLRRATPSRRSRSSRQRYFYPRSPCGERPIISSAPSPAAAFLSTLSLRRATVAELPAAGQLDISIHALLAESDPGQTRRAQPGAISIHALLAESDQPRWQPDRSRPDFYPRSPCGERPFRLLVFDDGVVISIHALLAESD